MACHFVEKGAIVTFLLRHPAVFDADQTIQEYVKKGKARLVKGDALSRAEVEHGWTIASEPEDGDAADATSHNCPVDVLLFTSHFASFRIGGTPSFHLTQGFVLNPPDLCSRSILNALSTVPKAHPYPRIVAVTSTGLTPTAYATLPLAVRLLYIFLKSAHEDKRGAERVLAYCMGVNEPVQKILPDGWEKTEGLAQRGELKSVVVVRPALLTDGDCRADKGGEEYRVRMEGDLAVKGGYTVSRKDVAHLITERVLGEEWSKWEGKGISVAY
ncbi:hypothetical protein EW146_g6438 [Bondarzewia mesenterica]|uniref:NAD(P)-binding domain-containing protein n=1 Tax=Bondarzewia mesenterica TaxID=1095465 RepID=A0A4S4LPH6_9AGAM|nr:hypothetical protein EW146_g6438 [Bondarzewia mesenterica]